MEFMAWSEDCFLLSEGTTEVVFRDKLCEGGGIKS